MGYDYSKLEGRIVEIYKTQKSFSSAMNWSERTTSLKLSNKVAWSQRDITKAANLLSIFPEEFGDYFFKLKVQRH